MIIATSTWDLQTPQAASIVAHELGIKGPAAFDVAAAAPVSVPLLQWPAISFAVARLITYSSSASS